MSKFQSIKNEDFVQLYQSNFGKVEPETCYYDPMGTNDNGNFGAKSMNLNRDLDEHRKNVADFKSCKFDARQELNFQVAENMAKFKSMTSQTGGAGTTDFVMNPINLDPYMWDLSRKELPARTMTRRVTNYGVIAAYNQVVSKGFGANYGDVFYAEEATFKKGTNEFARQSENIKLLGLSGTTTGLAQATIPNFVVEGFNYTTTGDGKVGTYTDQATPTAIDNNVTLTSKYLMEAEEWAIFNGDKTTNPLEFDGIIKTMGTTNTLDKNSSALALEDFRTQATVARKNGGYVDIAYLDLDSYDDVINLILDTKNGIVDYGSETEYGFNYVRLVVGTGTLKLIGSQFLSTVSGLKSAWLLDSRTWEMRVAQDMTYMPLAQTSDGSNFAVKMYEVLLCKATQFNASITEIL